jgi:hypothetical protein
MNDDELRTLIRAAIQRHLSVSGTVSPPELRRDGGSVGGGQTSASMSFGQYPLEPPAGDTSCLIEPAVQCNHCGFCKCHGH